MKKLVWTLLFIMWSWTAIFGTIGDDTSTSFQVISQKVNDGELTEAEGLYYKVIALSQPEQLPRELKGEKPLKSGTSFILQLKRGKERLLGIDNPILRALYDRPTGLTSTFNTPQGHFKLHYTTSGPDAVSSESYVQLLGSYLEYAWEFEIDSLEYREPPSDGTMGGDSRYDVYIMNIGAYGYTVFEDAGPEPWDDGISYIVIHNNFEGFPSNDDPEGDVIGAMKVTSAHEFFHAVQMSYDAYEETWWMEFTAVWMEECAWDIVNDYYNYLDDFFDNPEQTLFDADGYHEYACVVFPIYLTTKYDPELIKTIWIKCKEDEAMDALSTVLDSTGLRLEGAFSEFLAWNYYTSTRDDGEHYPEGGEYPGIHIEGVHSSYSASGSTIHPPHGWGSNYTVFRPPSGCDGDLEIQINLQTGNAWVVSVVGRAYAGTSLFQYYYLPFGGDTTIRVPSFANYRDVVLIPGVFGGDSETTYNYTYLANITASLYPPPEGVHATSGYEDYITLSWHPREGSSPDSYIVYRKVEGEPGFYSLAEVEDTIYNDYDIVTGRWNYYYVTALYGDIESRGSDTVSAIAGGDVVADSVWLRYDNGGPRSYLSDLVPGEAMAIRFLPETPEYDYKPIKASFYLFDFNDNGAESVKVEIYSVDSLTLDPDELLYESEPFLPSTFYPDGWQEFNLHDADITLPYPYGAIVAIRFLTGSYGSIPSVLVDESESVSHNTNYYFSATYNWQEHYEFWTYPNNEGYNMIRLLCERRTTSIEEPTAKIVPDKLTVLEVYPNPCNARANITLELEKPLPDSELYLYNTLGQKVQLIYKGSLHKSENIIGLEMSDFPSGLYFVGLKSGEDFVACPVMLLK